MPTPSTPAPARPALPSAADPRLTPITRDVEARLRRACAGMAPDDFAQLVDEIARRKLRWEAAG